MRAYPRVVILFALLLVSLTAPADTAQPIANRSYVVYFYHDMPPYMIEHRRHIGLYYDFVRMLNDVQDDIEFKAQFLPRLRIDYMLEHDLLPGVLLGVNPIWFKDKAQTHFYWSQPIFEDQDILISPAQAPIDYQGPGSLSGKAVAGVLGYYYYGISEAAEAGLLTVQSRETMPELLELLLDQQADAAIVGQAFFHYWVMAKKWQDRFYTAPTPHDRYTRHVLIPKRYPELRTVLDNSIRAMQQDPYWIRHVEEVMTGAYRYPP